MPIILRESDFVESFAPRLDEPRPIPYCAPGIDANSRASQIRDNQDRFGLVLVIRLTRN